MEERALTRRQLYYQEHRAEILAKNRERAQTDAAKQRKKENNARWRVANREKCRESERRFRANNPERDRESHHRSRHKHKVARTARRRSKYEILRTEAFAAYGSHCRCCGEAAAEFLTLDHVNNDGQRDRRPGGRGSGSGFLRKLKREGWPRDIQLLCWNCNLSKGLYGECPHIAEARKLIAA